MGPIWSRRRRDGAVHGFVIAPARSRRSLGNLALSCGLSIAPRQRICRPIQSPWHRFRPVRQPDIGQWPARESTRSNRAGVQTRSKPKNTGAGHSNPTRPLPILPPLASAIYPWVKILFWLAARGRCDLGVVPVWGLILMALRGAWNALLNFFAELFGWLRPAASARNAAPTTSRVPPFKLFKNPFRTGADRLWSPEKLIIYTYDALQSWAREQEAKQGSPQTPREFCRRLGGEMPEAADALAHLAFLYGHVAYGASVPGNYHPEQLRLLWDYMSNPRPIESKDREQVFRAL